MASTSHSGQVRNSHSPNVIALSSAKAPSTAAAKPRFRSRTGCWTCRKRKVKCDERGRTPETVAYGGLLSTSSGCKRCEDSGRPCHGYGAQQPSGPLAAHYPSNLNPHASLTARPYYSFSAHTQDNVNSTASFPVVMGNVEPDPRYVPQSMQWTQPFEQPFPENHAMNYGLRLLRNTPPCSSQASAAIGASALVPLNQASVPLPSIDLRRLSVPNYPTWQRSPQPRNTGASYSSGGLPANVFSMDQTSSPYENMEGEVLPPTAAPSTYQRGDHLLEVGECNARSADAYRNMAQNEISTVYNHDLSESDTQSLSFDFTRPHTSSGISLSFDDSQSYQILPKVYGSPIIANPKELECIDESSGVTSTSIPNCNDAAMQVWPESRASSVSIATFRRLSSTLDSHPLSPTQAPFFCAHSQGNERLKSQPSESFKKTGASDIPLFPSIRDIPHDVHHSQHPATYSAVCQADSASSEVERCCSDPVNKATERPLHLFQMAPSCHDTFAEMLSHNPHGNLRLNSSSYTRSCTLPTEEDGPRDPSPIRKDSSSSLSSSTTQQLNLSPTGITTHHPSVKNPSCTPCSMISPHPANHFDRPCIPPQRLSRGNSSLTAIDLSSQPDHSDRWAPHGLIPSLGSPPYNFKAILEQKGTEFHSIDAHEEDSPTSTAPSNTSGAPGAT